MLTQLAEDPCMSLSYLRWPEVEKKWAWAGVRDVCAVNLLCDLCPLLYAVPFLGMKLYSLQGPVSSNRLPCTVSPKFSIWTRYKLVSHVL